MPHDVNQYLFQDVAGLGDASPSALSAVSIRTSSTRTETAESSHGTAEPRRYALLILGGLIGPQQNDRDSYVRAVASSVVHAVQAHGHRRLKSLETSPR